MTPEDIQKMVEIKRGMDAEWPLWAQVLLVLAIGFILAQFGWAA